VNITAQPGHIICEDALATFTATPLNGGAAPVYQWKKNGTVVGVSSNMYEDSTLITGDAITCAMTSDLSCANPLSASGNTITMIVTPEVNPFVTINVLPGNPVCQGTSVTFTAVPVNGGPSPSYQWIKNLINVGTNSSTYVDNSFSTNDVISCNMTSNATCVDENPGTSNDIFMNVLPTMTLSNFSPSTGAVGSTVTINGSNFTGIAGVSFSGVSATFSVISTSQITAVVPAGAFSGAISISGNCAVITSASIFTIPGSSAAFDLKIFIEGYYRGSGQMAAALSPGVCDTVTVELHGNSAPYNLLFTARNVVSTTGNGSFNFPSSINGNSYYVVVSTRNSLKTWSALPIPFSLSTSYDFTNLASKAFGNNLKNLNDGNFAIFSGDVTQNGRIDVNDYNEIVNESQSFLSGYLNEDLTGDGIIESADFCLIENNNIPIITLFP
jgi:hypothetical protein